jgi:hypothetical protein
MTALAVCILCFSACAGKATLPTAPAPTEPPKVEPTEVPAPAPTEAPKAAEPTEKPAPTPSQPKAYPQPSEVILAGPKDGIDSVESAAAAKNIQLTRLGEPMTLDGIDSRLGGWLMALYGVSDTQADEASRDDWARVGDVVTIAYESGGLADPNYLIAADSASTPVVLFSPYHGGESPFGQPAPSPPDSYKTQWAFGAKPGGVNLPAAGVCKDPTKVFVFDSWPQKDYGLFSPVSFYVPPSSTTPPSPAGCTGNHGLFVSDLVKQAAPAASIDLYPVLDACGEGPLSNLNWALIKLLSQLPLNGSQPSVLNLSLGVQQATPPCFSESQQKILADKRCPRAWEDSKWPLVGVLDLCVFDLLLHLYRERGGVIVAAAGNGSFKAPDKPEPMQLPAAYDQVIGVVGNNKEGKRSCFSNLWKRSNSDFWVSAPAGEGNGDIPPNCDPAAIHCANNPDPNCPYALVGKIYGDQSAPQYAYWAGTSFATPLVSGLAACALASCGTDCKGPNPAKIPTDEVLARLQCGATPATLDATGAPDPMSPGRVIDVDKTLPSCSP